MDIAVIGTSKKENEKRVAIHPNHISKIPEKIRRHLFFEKGYGLPFNISDDEISKLTGNELVKRKNLLKNFKAILITKPVIEDFQEMQEGATVWGWIHTVLNSSITQLAIDKKLTLIAWENMYYRSERDCIHLFNKNNEMAGYCGVQHALELTGIDGNFGPSRKVSILSFGSVSRGSIYSLVGHGFKDITVYTKRPTYLIKNKIPGINYKQIIKNDNDEYEIISSHEDKKYLINELIQSDIIVNGVLQNPNNPMMFVNDDDVDKFKKTCLIIDISCSKGMGFSFAHSTTFSKPIFEVSKIKYYSIDHTPTILWDSASYEISSAILPYIKNIVEKSDNKVIIDAIDIKDGKILNKDILSFQNRSVIYPYRPL